MKSLRSEYSFDIELPSVKNVAEYVIQKVLNFSKAGRQECITNTITGVTFNYDQIGPLSIRVKNAFVNRGMKKGDTVIYSSHDGAKLHIFLLGIWQANGIARSSYPEDVGEDLIERILESNAKWILCDENNAENVLKATTNIPWHVEIIVPGHKDCCTSLKEFFDYTEDTVDQEKNEMELSDIALILPTSGTTGRSKGAVYTHENLLKNILIFEKLPFIDKPEDPFLLTSRLTHFTGTVFPLAFFSAGRRIIINPAPCKENILRDVAYYRVRCIFTFPKYISGLVQDKTDPERYDVTCLKSAICSGQAVSEPFIASLKDANISFTVIYGMTEVGLLTTNADWSLVFGENGHTLEDFPFTSCGKLAPGNKLQVRDIETGELQEVGKLGEFYFKSPFACSGYLNSLEANKETFLNRWVRTGDVGYYDQNGFIFMKDRTKEIFKYFNNHICPTDLEGVLLTHPCVLQACVVGVPDHEGGDTIPRGFVVLKNDLKGISANANNIKEYFNGKVASYKQLRGGLFIVKEIPIGKTEKFDRKALQNAFIN